MITVTNLTKKKAPNIAWEIICEKILGKKYRLSVVLTNNSMMKKLNTGYRNDNKPASVLSFPYSSDDGEIFINTNYDKNSILLLFVHGLLHLKGYKHGDKMETLEKKYCIKFEEGLKHKK
ncbi:rRNA maturation RNAse YbeY [Patescibacteria group bacterium]